MSVSGIGSGWSQSASSLDSAQLLRRQEWKALQSVLQASDVKAVQSVNPAPVVQVNGSDAVAAPSQSPFDTFKSDFSSLIKAIQSGDMVAAKDALTALQSDSQAVYGANGRTANANTGVAKDLQALVDAVNAGDSQAAQKALQSLVADTKALHHGHRHHSQGGGSISISISISSSSNTASSIQRGASPIPVSTAPSNGATASSAGSSATSTVSAAQSASGDKGNDGDSR